MSLRQCYALSGTEVAYGATSTLYKLSSTEAGQLRCEVSPSALAFPFPRLHALRGQCAASQPTQPTHVHARWPYLVPAQPPRLLRAAGG
eukprot:3940044-Rhodomonas_salina.2